MADGYTPSSSGLCPADMFNELRTALLELSAKADSCPPRAAC